MDLSNFVTITNPFEGITQCTVRLNDVTNLTVRVHNSFDGSFVDLAYGEGETVTINGGESFRVELGVIDWSGVETPGNPALNLSFCFTKLT